MLTLAYESRTNYLNVVLFSHKLEQLHVHKCNQKKYTHVPSVHVFIVSRARQCILFNITPSFDAHIQTCNCTERRTHVVQILQSTVIFSQTDRRHFSFITFLRKHITCTYKTWFFLIFVLELHANPFMIHIHSPNPSTQVERESQRRGREMKMDDDDDDDNADGGCVENFIAVDVTWSIFLCRFRFTFLYFCLDPFRTFFLSRFGVHPLFIVGLHFSSVCLSCSYFGNVEKGSSIYVYSALCTPGCFHYFYFVSNAITIII